MPEKNYIAPLSRQLLRDKVAASMRQLITEQDLWEAYLPSERDLAERFRVNRDTVRKGLDILEEQGMIARRQGLGNWVLSKPRREIRQGGSRVAVASCWHNIKVGYIGEIFTGLTGGAAQPGWSVKFFGKLNESVGLEALRTTIRRGELDGLVLFTNMKLQLVKELLDLWPGPTVMIDHYYPDLSLTSVMDDSQDGARQVIEHFLSLGHRRIGYVDLPNHTINPWRFKGYSLALNNANVDLDSNLVTSCHINMDEGRAAGARLLDQPNPPTAIMAFNDCIAWGVWQAAEERGLTIGKDFALAGFGDSASAAGFPEKLTSVRVDLQAVGRTAANELGNLMAGRAQPGRLLLVPTELVIRHSSENAWPEAHSKKEFS